MKKVKVIDPALLNKAISKSESSKILGGSSDPVVTDLGTVSRSCASGLDIWREKENKDECQPKPQD
jgi:hypothetical protein